MAFGLGNRNVVAATFVARDDASKTIGKLRTNMKSLGTKTGGPLGGMIGGFAGMVSPAMLGVAAVGALAATLGESVKKAIEEEKGIKRLDTALENNVKAYDGNRDAIEAVIAEREKLAFSDGEQRDSLGLLVARTHDVNEALDLQRQAMDLARAKGMSLADASMLIGKVYSGNVAILKRYGIQVRKGASATEALATIQEQTAGQAQTFADTTEGAMQSMNIAIENVMEDVGTAMLPVFRDVALAVRDDLIPALKDLGGAFFHLNEATGESEFVLDEWMRKMDEVAEKSHVAFVQPFHKAADSVIGDSSRAAATLEAVGSKPWWKGWEQGAQHIVGSIRKIPPPIKDTFGHTIPAAIREGGPMVEAAVQAAVQNPIVTRIRQSIAFANRKTKELGPTLHDTIIGGKGTVDNAMGELMWSLKHPFAEENYRNWLARKMRAANKARNTALKSGNATAIADAQRAVNSILSEYNRLNGLDMNIVVRSTVYHGSGRSNTGGGTRGSHGGHRALGGPVWGGESYIVGERGPERLVMASGQNGQVLNRGQDRGWGGVTPHSHPILLDGRVVANAVDERMGRQMAYSRTTSLSRSA